MTRRQEAALAVAAILFWLGGIMAAIFWFLNELGTYLGVVGGMLL